MDDIEVYVLCGDRSLSTARRFLEQFAPKRSSAAADFPFPQYSDHALRTYSDPDELIEILESRAHQPYSFYWNGEGESAVRQVMLFFTEDGGMIAGVSGPIEAVEDALVEISEVVGGRYGYITNEAPPPDTVTGFKAICEQSTLPNIYEGRVRLTCDGDSIK
jgi:hypothetical protein